MGIELIPDEGIETFALVDEEQDENWIIKKELKKMKEKYFQLDGEATKDISLLFGYIGYLERELEDKKNYLDFLKGQRMPMGEK
jgi:hypothetical protein